MSMAAGWRFDAPRSLYPSPPARGRRGRGPRSGRVRWASATAVEIPHLTPTLSPQRAEREKPAGSLSASDGFGRKSSAQGGGAFAALLRSSLDVGRRLQRLRSGPARSAARGRVTFASGAIRRVARHELGTGGRGVTQTWHRPGPIGCGSTSHRRYGAGIGRAALNAQFRNGRRCHPNRTTGIARKLDDPRFGRHYVETNTGTGICASKVRVVPPSKSSRNRE